MRTRVKICGITRPGDAVDAAKSGADAIGLVFYPRSPRYLSTERAVEIRDADTTLRVVVTEGSTATVRILHDNGSGLKPSAGVPVRLIPRGF